MNRTIVIISTGRILQIALSLVSVRLFTSLLSPRQVGNLFLINTIAAFFGLVLINPVGMYLNRRLHHWFHHGRLPDAFIAFNLYLIGVSLLSVPIVLFMNKALHVGSDLSVMVLMAFVMLNIYIGSWNQTIVPTLNMLQHRKSFVWFSLLTTIIGLGCSVLFVCTIERGALWWLLGQVTAQGAVTIGAFAYYQKFARGTEPHRIQWGANQSNNIRRALRFVAPLTVTTLFWWLQNQSYRIFVERIVGLEYLAMIGLGLSIAANIAAAVESLIQQFYYPIYYGQINTDDQMARRAAWVTMASMTLPVYVGTAIFAVLLSPFIVNLLAGPRYKGIMIYVMLGALIELFRTSSNVLASIAHAELKTSLLIKPYVTGAVCATVGVYVGAHHPQYQLMVPLALVVSGLTMSVVMFFEMNKVMPVHVNWPQLIRTILVSLPVTAVLSLYHLSHIFIVSAIVCIVCGGYFIGSQYLVLKGATGREQAHG